MSDSNNLVESLRKVSPAPPSASSEGLGWIGVQAFRFRHAPGSEFVVPPLAQHAVILFKEPPEKLDLRYEEVRREQPPTAGSIQVVPAGCPALWHWQGNKDSFHVYLEPALVAGVATEAFGFDASRAALPPLDGLNAPEVRAAMLALDAELRVRGAGGPLMAESLAHVLSVHLLRSISCGPAIRMDGVLPRRKLARVVEYIVDHLESGPTLEQMAAVVHLSPYHFARQFKATTGVPPHRYVIARRVERAQQILKKDDEISLAEVALQVGFSDQSRFSFHFKRIAGVTPGRFRALARIA